MPVARCAPVTAALALAWVLFGLPATASAENLSCAEIEEFLRLGSIGALRNIPKGVTLPRRATLEYKGVRHDASIQTVDISKAEYKTIKGSELNFRDSWKYNVAGYELAKILELNMVPPYVERSVGGYAASLSWWVNDTMMEYDRRGQKIEVPDKESWNKQMYAVRVLQQLVYDTDPNLTNLLITKDWQLWVIDFTRAFRFVQDSARSQRPRAVRPQITGEVARTRQGHAAAESGALADEGRSQCRDCPCGQNCGVFRQRNSREGRSRSALRLPAKPTSLWYRAVVVGEYRLYGLEPGCYLLAALFFAAVDARSSSPSTVAKCCGGPAFCKHRTLVNPCYADRETSVFECRVGAERMGDARPHHPDHESAAPGSSDPRGDPALARGKTGPGQ